MLQLDKIVEGFYNNVTNREEELYEKRIAICKTCPLYKNSKMFGAICNPALYINDKDEISKSYKPGYIKGCGCFLNSKTRLIDSKCIISKW